MNTTEYLDRVKGQLVVRVHLVNSPILVKGEHLRRHHIPPPFPFQCSTLSAVFVPYNSAVKIKSCNLWTTRRRKIDSM